MHKYIKRFLAAALSTITIFSTVGISFAATESAQSKAHVQGMQGDGSSGGTTYVAVSPNPHHSSINQTPNVSYYSYTTPSGNGYGDICYTAPNNYYGFGVYTTYSGQPNTATGSSTSSSQNSSCTTVTGDNHCYHSKGTITMYFVENRYGITTTGSAIMCLTCGEPLGTTYNHKKSVDSLTKKVYGTATAANTSSGNFKLTTIDQKQNNMTFKWTDSNKNVGSYQVFKCYEGTYDGKCTWKGSKNITGKVKGNSVTVSNCNHTGKVFGFYVESFDKKGKHLGYSQILCTKRLRYDTGTPQIFKKDTQYGVKWNKAASTQGYIVEVAENSFKTNKWEAIKVSGSNTTQVFPGLQKGKKYSVRVTTFGTCVIPKFSITVKDNKNKKHTLKWTPSQKTYTITGKTSVAKVYKMQ